MNLVEKILPKRNFNKLMVLLVKGLYNSEIVLIKEEEYNYYCAKYGHHNIELIARKGLN